jgi:hypothetical protein
MRTLELRNGILLDRDGVDPQADITVSMNCATFNLVYPRNCGHI